VQIYEVFTLFHMLVDGNDPLGFHLGIVFENVTFSTVLSLIDQITLFFKTLGDISSPSKITLRPLSSCAPSGGIPLGFLLGSFQRLSIQTWSSSEDRRRMLLSLIFKRSLPWLGLIDEKNPVLIRMLRLLLLWISAAVIVCLADWGRTCFQLDLQGNCSELTLCQEIRF